MTAIRNIITQEESTTDALHRIGATVNVTWENSQSLMQAAGWRIKPAMPPIADGETRIAATFVDDNGTSGKWEVTDRLVAELDAEAAAGRKAAMAAQLTPGLVALAAAYRTALRAIGGPGAEVNRKVTQAAVVGAMLALPPEQYDAKTADMLKLAFEEICKVTGTGETWTFFETVGDLIPEVTP